PESGPDGFAGRAGVAPRALRDHETELLPLRRQDRRELLPSRLLRRVVLGELAKRVELARQRRDGLVVRLQVCAVARQHVPALRRLCLGRGQAKDGDLLEDTDRVARPVSGFERELLLAQRRQTDRENQGTGARQRGGDAGLETPATPV